MPLTAPQYIPSSVKECFLFIASEKVDFLVGITAPISKGASLVVIRKGCLKRPFGNLDTQVGRGGHNEVLQGHFQVNAMVTQNAMERKGSTVGSYIKAIAEVVELDAQIGRLKRELAATYQPGKLLSINPVDLEAERKNTKRCLERLAIKREAMLQAHAQNTKRAWTEHGDFSNVLHTGVILNGH